MLPLATSRQWQSLLELGRPVASYLDVDGKCKTVDAPVSLQVKASLRCASPEPEDDAFGSFRRKRYSRSRSKSHSEERPTAEAKVEKKRSGLVKLFVRDRLGCYCNLCAGSSYDSKDRKSLRGWTQRMKHLTMVTQKKMRNQDRNNRRKPTRGSSRTSARCP